MIQIWSQIARVEARAVWDRISVRPPALRSKSFQRGAQQSQIRVPRCVGSKVPFVTGRQEARELPWLGALDGGEGVGRIQPWPATAACLQLRRHNRITKPQKLDLHFCSAPYANSSGHSVTISWTRAPGIACTRAFLGPFARRRSGVASRPDVDVPTLTRQLHPGLGHPSCTRLAPSRVRRSLCLTPRWLIDGFA